MFENIYKNKKILITGHTGFKGSWLAIWLNQLGANVSGVSIGEISQPSNFKVSGVVNFCDDYQLDIRNSSDLKELVKKLQPDFIFHLAAQALVRPSYKDPLSSLTINAIGTANVLEAIRCLEKKAVAVMITSDKAYDNEEWSWGYREIDRLGGKDPYSASKGMAELAIRSYVESFYKKSDVRVGIARAGNVIGGGDWAIDRIVPDCMRAWANGDKVDIRSPNATRPWQHVLEPVSGYLLLGLYLYKASKSHGEAYNFGPNSYQDYSVSALINEMSRYWDKIKWRDVSGDFEHVHEAGLLKLNCDKALHDLNWHSVLDFKETVKYTVEWYKEYYQNSNKSMIDFTNKQIELFTKSAKIHNLDWAKK